MDALLAALAALVLWLVAVLPWILGGIVVFFFLWIAVILFGIFLANRSISRSRNGFRGFAR